MRAFPRHQADAIVASDAPPTPANRRIASIRLSAFAYNRLTDCLLGEIEPDRGLAGLLPSMHTTHSKICFAIAIVCLAIAGVGAISTAHGQDTNIEFFETHVRPLLIDACIPCHGASENEGGLRLDTREFAFRGGETGNAIVPGEPDGSLLIQAVRRLGDLKMPPDRTLSADQIDTLVQWIRSGAPWPEQARLIADDVDSPHWAFQPIIERDVPEVTDSDWVRTPVDAFALRKLSEVGLNPSPRADPRTLVRRLSFDLTGLPPTISDVEAFAADPSQQAWESLIDRLLDSPHYGEKWARHWLDLARYSDSKGYVYAREERFWVHAWAYRDWVVQALNDDMPYDRFLLLQIAADQVPCEKRDLAAMGFMTLGRRFLGVSHDIIDDRINVLTRSTMAMTVACARCHDHKYDPIPTEDYYSLVGVFRNCSEQLVAIGEMPDAESEFAKGLRERTDKLAETIKRHRDAAAERVRARLHDYLMAQLHLDDYPEAGFDQIYVETDIIPEFVRRWRDFLDHQAEMGDTVFEAWRRFRALPPDTFEVATREVWRQLRDDGSGRIDQRVASAFDAPPTSMENVVAVYAKLLSQVDQAWKASRADVSLDDDSDSGAGSDPLLRVLYGEQSPCVVPDEPIVNIDLFLPTNQTEELWRLSGDVDRFLMNSADAPPHALILADKSTPPIDARVFRRGNPRLLGERVPRRFLSALNRPDGEQSHPFEQGSGRLELARAITSPDNPLTPRVMVNRIWQHHFGQGMVRTPSDFGRRADPPSHPELLDWLANALIENEWSIKSLHKMILMSSTYQQRSIVEFDRSVKAAEIDPENRLLWRMNPRRLSFESLRDSMLAAAGELDQTVGGRAVDLITSSRRTLYTQVDRQFFSTLKRSFDVASPDLHIERRPETVVPQQALFFLNHPFLLERAKTIAAAGRSLDDQQRVRAMFRQLYQREPTKDQMEASLHFIAEAESPNEPTAVLPPEWSYGYGQFDSGAQRIANFTPLPYFDGNAWQGGTSYPDQRLGWVQLHATGGHPGNTTAHASIRRWTESQPMTIKIESELRHDAQPGDGVRAYLVSSRTGLIKTADIHQAAERFDVDAIEVQPGETIDFVVDILQVLNSDQYQWTMRITELAKSEAGREWDSQRDFGGPAVTQLGPWELLAQVLLSANEFTFVD